MRSVPASAPVLALVLLLVVGASSCDETNPVVIDIGTTQLLILDSRNVGQTLSSSGNSVQDVTWRVTQATLTLPDQVVDLLLGDPTCQFFDTPFVTGGVGACSRGLIIDAFEDPVPIRLDLTLTMDVYRAEPFVLPAAGANSDFDGDQVGNDGDGDGIVGDAPCANTPFCPGDPDPRCDDNCPLLVNCDQVDSNIDGFGDACTIIDPLSGRSSVDSDGDLVPDLLDNCVWEPNPGQENTLGLAAEGIGDGVGDACSEQMISVNSGQTIQLSLAVDLVQARNSATVLTVDFDSEAGLICDWSAGTCNLDPAQVRFCAQASSILATLGCP